MSLPFTSDDGDSDPTNQGDAFDTMRIDATLADRLTPHGPDGEREAIRVRPFKEHGGIETAVEFLEATHELQTKGGRLRPTRNVSPAHTFEIRYTGNRVNFQFVPADGWTNFIERQVKDKYPESQVERTPANLAAFDEGKHVAAADLELDRYTLYPIKHLDLEGFNRDPFGSITSEMTGTQIDGRPDADVVVQIVFKPAVRSWTDGVDGGPSITGVERRILQTEYEWDGRWLPINRVPIEPGPKEKEAAKIVRNQSGEKAWHVNLRVFAVSEDADIAAARVQKAAGMFRNYYESRTEQRFIPRPLAGRELREGIENAVARRFVENGIVKSQSEVAGLVHIPNDTINQQNVEWALSRPGEGIPPGTPRFDFDAHGVTTASDEEKQIAMVDESGPGDPFFLGRGSRNGIEAGVDPKNLDAHVFVGGGTRKGKTTATTNFGSQLMERGRGCLAIMLGKGDDDEDFISEWPEDRPEEDFVFIDTGPEYDHKTRFNLLSIPDGLEPGTPQFDNYVDMLSNDMAAAFSQAGGTDNYWGALMARVFNTVIHGMAKSDYEESTLVDAAACMSAQRNLEQFSQWMSEEQIHFVKDAAERIEEKEDEELEPLAGRMDKLLFNGTLRELLSAREPTISVQEIVDQEKVAVLRLDPGLSQENRNFITTPLVRRFYNAKKSAPHGDERPFLLHLGRVRQGRDRGE